MARFIIDNIIDLSSLRSDHAFSTLPVDNVKKISRSLITRFENIDPIILEGVFNGPKNISAFIISGHNFVESTAYELIFYSDQLFSNLVFSTGIIDQTEEIDIYNIYNNILPIWLNENVNALSFRFIIYKSPDVSDYNYEIYRIFAGEYFETKINISNDSEISWKDTSVNYRTDAGTLRSDASIPIKNIKFNLPYVDEYERYKLHNFLVSIGLRKEFYIDIFPNSTSAKANEYRGIVKLTKMPIFQEYSNNFFKSSYNLEGV